MKSLKLTITVCFLSSLLFNGLNAQLDVEYEWVAQMWGATTVQVYDIALDGDENVYAIGRFNGSSMYVNIDNFWDGSAIPRPGSNDDFFIVKYDKNKNFIWGEVIGSARTDRGFSITTDNFNNVYITGVFNGANVSFGGILLTSKNQGTSSTDGDTFVAKINSSGTFLWAKSFGGTSTTAYGHSIAADPSGNVYVTGYFTGTINFNTDGGTEEKTAVGSGSNGYLLKLNSNGNFQWVNTYGASGSDVIGRAVVADGSAIYVMGYFNGTVDFKSTGSYPQTSSVSVSGGADHLGSYFVLRISQSLGMASAPIVISRSGAFSWSHGRTLALSGGYVYVTGEQGNNAFVAKYDASLNNQQWMKTFGATARGNGIAVDGDGNVYTTGYFEGASFSPGGGGASLSKKGTRDAYLHVLDGNGDFLTAKQFGGSGAEVTGMGIKVAPSPSKAIYIGGFFGNYNKTTDFDPNAGIANVNPLSSSRDGFIVKLNPMTCTTPSAPTAVDQSFCDSDAPTVADLIASGETGATFTWYNVSTGGTALPSGTALANGTYYVSQTVDGCESSRTAVTVTINPGPSAPSTNATQVFCNSATVGDLIATGSDLQWYDVATGGSPLSSGTALTNGTYYVSQTVDGCESSRIPVTVEVTTDLTPSVSISGTPTSSICAGESVTFTATPTNGGSNPAYQWQINGVDVSGETGSTFTTTDLNDGDIVTVVMTSDHPCANPTSASADTDEIVVGDDEAPVFTDCPTDITVSSGNDCEAIVTWTSPTATDNCTTTPVITSSHNSGDIFPVGTTEVTYTAEDDAGNVTTCSFNVTVVDDEVPVFVSCVSDTAMFIEEACGVVLPDFTLAVDVADNCSSATAGTLTLTQNPAAGTSLGVGTHTVELLLEDAGGNTSTCSFEIVVSDTLAPVIEIEGLSATYCAGEEVVWTTNISDNCGVDTVTSTHDSGESFPVGTTTVTYTAVDASGNVSTYSFDVVVGALPSAADLGAADFSVCLGRDITLSIDNPEENTTYSWVFLGDEVGTGTSHTVTSSTLDDEGTYIVVSTSPEGCVSVTEVELSVNQCEIVISGGISPNGDGLNDVFEIGGIEAYPKTEVWIYNRWGTEVFHSEDYQNNWDGTSQSSLNVGGNELPEGTYYYVIRLGGYEGQLNAGETYKGYVYLKR